MECGDEMEFILARDGSCCERGNIDKGKMVKWDLGGKVCERWWREAVEK